MKRVYRRQPMKVERFLVFLLACFSAHSEQERWDLPAKTSLRSYLQIQIDNLRIYLAIVVAKVLL